jgi:mono/diheme cytochrome c family protein/cytochrome c553
MRFYKIGITTAVAVVLLGVSNYAPSIANDNLFETEQFMFADDTPVWDVLAYFGRVKLHTVDTKMAGVSAERGKELIFEGITTNAETGKKTSRQSKYFTCVSCHNVAREFGDLADNKPESRLKYAIENNLPYLQGSTFFGIVNREKYFNGDYQQLYANATDIKAAASDLRKAIQVCATNGAQGRALEAWETESILAYFWTLQLRLSDLNLTKDDREKIEYAVTEKSSLSRAVNIVEDKYLDASPAKFVPAMEYRTLDSQISRNEARIANGKNIYDLGCKHCHEGKRFSRFALDDSPKTFKNLVKKLEQGHKKSLYKITRYGTYQPKGKRAYMPQYSQEKMSNEQLLDLRIYIEKMAGGSSK